MATKSYPIVMRLMGSCISIAERAGEIIREIMVTGDLNVVDKVRN
jgi:hypothetical protein